MKKRTALALVTLVFNLSLVERLHAGGSFSTTGSLATYRDRHTATYLPNGKVLVVGGLSGPFLGWVALSSAELYDPAAATWTNTGSLAITREQHTATLLPNGKVLVTGGVYGIFNTGQLYYPPDSELYDPATGSWTYSGAMNVPRYNHTATLLPSGKVLVTGGLYHKRPHQHR